MIKNKPIYKYVEKHNLFEKSHIALVHVGDISDFTVKEQSTNINIKNAKNGTVFFTNDKYQLEYAGNVDELKPDSNYPLPPKKSYMRLLTKYTNKYSVIKNVIDFYSEYYIINMFVRID
jgi:hypothetical protein